jgi:chromosome segregation ATPase
VQEAAQRTDQAQARAVAAESRVTELEERLADANRASAPAPTDERIMALEGALADARAEAVDAARRAEATEAVREELEVKVAQFGSRAQEQEATATALAEQLREIEAVRADLERRASDAESGGDAVRSEMAQLTAERDSFKARVAELERAAATAEPPTRSEADIEELELLASARTELADLRQQLGHAIEKARAAEERSAKLEADLLAERQGIRELSETQMGSPLEEALDDEAANPFPWMDVNGNGNGTSPTDDQPAADEPEPADEAEDPEDTEPPAPDKSLRYRLAQSAARKKGLGELELPS